MVFFPNKNIQLRNWIWSSRKANPKAEEAELTARIVFNPEPMGAYEARVVSG